MKVIFKYGIKTYSGTIDQMVYGSYRDDNLCIGREYVYPTLTEQNTLLGTISKNLSALYALASGDYITDLKAYAVKNASENVPKTQLAPTAYAVFIKLMYAWRDDDPEHVDLSTVTDADVDTIGTKVATIAAAVANGLLPSVSDAETLTGVF